MTVRLRPRARCTSEGSDTSRSNAPKRSFLHRRRSRGDKGSVLLEMVIITPLILMITLSVFDLGMGWRASLAVSSAARSGARVSSNLGRSAATDSETIRAVAAGLDKEGLEVVDRVIIFKSTDPDGIIPSTCLLDSVRTTGGSSTYNCNVYSGAEVRAISEGSASAPTFSGDCSTSRDRFYCPSTRGNDQAVGNGPDYLGVYIQINHENNSKIFGETMEIKDTAVMRIEPGAGGF